eukprot:TRINITY_DN19524_c0_g1_i1.p1 TRINITY_DN19524_c0_g1~~TRINITY_DN19524_c0_g1_i1.p1  ORF type:complete len:355 (-),score=66.67 TRINITY_DN19524_c0_g1_i1:68-1132(-)
MALTEAGNVDAQISHDPVSGWPAAPLAVATVDCGSKQYSELVNLPPLHDNAPTAPEPSLPPAWAEWAEPSRRDVDAWVQPDESRPHSTLHLTPKPDLRASGEHRLVSCEGIDEARTSGIDVTVTHAAENGGEQDVVRSLNTIREHVSAGKFHEGGLAVNISAEEAAPVWRHLMMLLVTGNHTKAEFVWRALRGEMDCVCETGYHQGWQTDSYQDCQSSAAQFPEKPTAKSELAFSPDCRYVAEYGNTKCGGSSSFTTDTYEVRVYDVTSGRLVHQQQRDETQGFCQPYEHAGGALEHVLWLACDEDDQPLPHTLQVLWTDEQEFTPKFEKSVSCFHFNPTTWRSGRRSVLALSE